MSSPLLVLEPLSDWQALLGDINELEFLTEHFVGVITVVISSVCGAILGLEREKRDKPAGLRTLVLICLGSTIFTMASLLIAGKEFPDRGRIAAQIVTGIGFLGAGAIIHERRSVVGLTTAATIWAVAAIGIVVGLGYAAAGLVLSVFIFLILSFLRILEGWMLGPCHIVTTRIHFRPEGGKTRHAIVAIIDDHHVAHDTYRFDRQTGEADLECAVVKYCGTHRHHRTFLSEIIDLKEVTAVEEVG